jgi:hypothetical protein
MMIAAVKIKMAPAMNSPCFLGSRIACMWLDL